MEVNKDNIKSECLKKWDKDKQTEYFCEIYEDWISSFNNEEIETALLLLQQFDYYSVEDVNKVLSEHYSELFSNYEIDKETTAYTVLKKKDGKSNSSMSYIEDFKRLHNIDNAYHISDIRAYAKEHKINWDNIKNIVIVDDMIGSGKSIRDFANDHNDILVGKNIYMLVIHCMNDSDLGDFSVNVISKNKRCKGLSVISADGNEESHKINIRTHSKRNGINDELGYKKTQSLCAFYNNTPNCTFGMFHYNRDENEYKSLFPRKKTIAPFKKSKKNKKSNYGVKSNE